MIIGKISERLFQIERAELRIRYFDNVLQFVDSHISVLIFVDLLDPLPDTREVLNFCLKLKSGNRLKAEFSLSHTDVWAEVAHLINRIAFASLFRGESKLL